MWLKNLLLFSSRIVNSLIDSFLTLVAAIFNSLNPSTAARRHMNYVLVGLLWLSYVLVVPAEANPNLDKVVSGDVNIVESGHKMDVIQGTQKAIIDWRSFSIGVDEHTQFHHTNSSAVTLNRVTGVDPSNILGRLSANGNIILINPNGVMFGANSRVDVNSMIATTADIRNEDFLIGKLKFSKAGNPLAKIINQGQITAGESGFIGLIAPSVENSGIIKARLGKVHLAAGDTFTFDMYGDGLMEIAVSDETVKKVVKNSGIVDAAGGEIYITAAAGNNVANSLIEIKGELRAPAVEQRGGKIIIFAEGSNAVKGNKAADKGVRSGESKVIVEAKLDVSGNGDGQSGGDIQVLGDYVGLMYGSALIATGHSGGGEVNVGGDYLGGGNTAAAKNVYVDAGVDIDVSATESGDGGKAIVWSDSATKFYGEILAKGGALSGDGGFVEVSGKDYLEFRGNVDTSAANGNYGELLLDPSSIIVCQFAGTCSYASQSSYYNVLDENGNGIFDSGSETKFSLVNIGSVGEVGSLVDLLTQTNVTIKTGDNGKVHGGDIYLLNDIISNSDRKLTLKSHNTTRFYGNVSVRDLTIVAKDIFIYPKSLDSGYKDPLSIMSNNGLGRLHIVQFDKTKGINIGGYGINGFMNISSPEFAQFKDWKKIHVGNNKMEGAIKIGNVDVNSHLVLKTKDFIKVKDDVNIAEGKNVKFVSNTIDIWGKLSGGRNLTLHTYDLNRDILIGSTGAHGTYFLDSPQIENFKNGWKNITIGRGKSTGLTVLDAVAWGDSNMKFMSGYGLIDIRGDQTFQAGKNAIFQTNRINIAGELLGGNQLSIKTSDIHEDMIVGGSINGYLSLEDWEVDNFKNGGWKRINLGNTSGLGKLVLKETTWGDSDMQFFSRNGLVDIQGKQKFFDGQRATFMTNRINIDAELEGGEELNIKTRDKHEDMVVGGSVNGWLSLENFEVDNFKNGGWERINLGNTRNTGKLLLKETVWGGADMHFGSRTGLIDIQGKQTFQDGRYATFTTDRINVADELVGGKYLRFRTSSKNEDMVIGGSVNGWMSLENFEVDNFKNGGWNNISFGRGNNDGKLLLNATNWGDSNVIFKSGYGLLDIQGDQVFHSGRNAKFLTNRINVDADLVGGKNLRIRTTDKYEDTVVGGSINGWLSLENFELDHFKDKGWKNISIGNARSQGYNQSGRLLLKEVDWGDSNMRFISGYGLLDVQGTQTFQNNRNAAFLTNRLNVDADLIGGKNLRIRTTDKYEDTVVGGSINGWLSLENFELDHFKDKGWNKIIIGNGRSEGYNQKGRLLLKEVDWGNSDMKFVSRNGLIDIQGDQTFQDGTNVEFKTNRINVDAKLQGGDELVIRTRDAYEDMVVGGSVNGWLSLENFEVNNFKNGGWDQIRLGQWHNTGILKLMETTWGNSDMIFASGNGLLDVKGTQTFQNGYDAKFQTNRINIYADLLGGDTLRILTSDKNEDMVVGGSVNGWLSLENFELNHFKDKGWNRIALGNTSGLGKLLLKEVDWGNVNYMDFFSRDGLVDVQGVQRFKPQTEVKFQTNRLNIDADMFGGDKLNIYTRDIGEDMIVGGSVNGWLSLEQFELDHINGKDWNYINFGIPEGKGKLKVVGDNTWLSNIKFANGTGLMSFHDDQTFTKSAIIEARKLSILGGLIGSQNGDLTIRNSRVDGSLGIGANPVGELKIDTNEIANIANGWRQLNIGRNDGTGALNVSDATFFDNLVFETKTGTITIDGDVTMQDYGWLSIVSDVDPVINGNLYGNGGVLQLFTQSDGTTIGVGGAGGTYNLSDSELDNIKTGWQQVSIGKDSGTGKIDLGKYEWDQNVAVKTKTGVITVVGDTEILNGKDLTFKSNADIRFHKWVKGTGELNIMTHDDATGIGIGGGAGALNISVNDLTCIHDGWSKIIFGRTDYNGVITVGKYTKWKDPVQFITGNSGVTRLNGEQKAIGNGAFDYNSPLFINTAKISTLIGDVNFGNTVNLLKDVDIKSNTGDFNFNGNTINYNGFDLDLTTGGTITY